MGRHGAQQYKEVVKDLSAARGRYTDASSVMLDHYTRWRSMSDR